MAKSHLLLLISFCIMNKSLLTGHTDNMLVQLFRYAFVGGTAFVVDFGLLALLTEWCGLNYQLSACISFIAGLTVNYLMSIRWVFNQSSTLPRSQKIADFVSFAIVGIIGLGLNALIMWLFTDILTLHYLLSKIISTVVVFFWNFIGRRTFIQTLSRRLSYTAE